MKPRPSHYVITNSEGYQSWLGAKEHLPSDHQDSNTWAAGTIAETQEKACNHSVLHFLTIKWEVRALPKLTMLLAWILPVVYKRIQSHLSYMWISIFPSTTYRRDHAFPVVYSQPRFQTSIDHICLGLSLGFLFCLWLCYQNSTCTVFITIAISSSMGGWGAGWIQEVFGINSSLNVR